MMKILRRRRIRTREREREREKEREKEFQALKERIIFLVRVVKYF